MKRTSLMVWLLASIAAATAADTEASIPFANRDGIYDWRVVDSRTVLIESLDRKWYKATLMSSCFDLPFAERIGFQTNPDGSFDKFGAIKLRDQYCPLTSLVKTDPPVKKAKRHANADVSTSPPAAPAPPSSAP